MADKGGHARKLLSAVSESKSDTEEIEHPLDPVTPTSRNATFSDVRQDKLGRISSSKQGADFFGLKALESESDQRPIYKYICACVNCLVL